MTEPMQLDVSGIDPDLIAEAIQKSGVHGEAPRSSGAPTRGPASVGKPFSGRALKRAQGKRSNLSTHLAVDFDDRVELVAVRRAPKRVSGGRTRS